MILHRSKKNQSTVEANFLLPAKWCLKIRNQSRSLHYFSRSMLILFQPNKRLKSRSSPLKTILHIHWWKSLRQICCFTPSFLHNYILRWAQGISANGNREKMVGKMEIKRILPDSIGNII